MGRFFLATLLMILIPTETFGSVVFQSLLPNPAWDDTLGEYIEIRNTGCTSIDIWNYSLSDASGKTYTLPSGTSLTSQGSRRFPYSETKIALNNSGNESVYFKDPSNNLLDSYQYSGTQKDNVVITISLTDDSCIEEPILTSSGTTEAHTGWVEIIVSTGSTSSGIVDTSTGLTLHLSGSTTSTGEISSWSTASWDSSTNSGSSMPASTGSTTSGSTEASSDSGSLSWSTSLWENTGSSSASGNTNSGNTTTLIYAETGLLVPLDMYYRDTDGNKRIDTLEISYPYSLTGIVNTWAISLYSNTGWIFFSRINTLTGYISTATLSGNTLILKLQEGDIEKEVLKINNTTTSDLRLKSSGNLGFQSLGWQTPEPFFLTSSFSEYKKVYKKSGVHSSWSTLSGTVEASLSWSGIVGGNTWTTSTGITYIENTGIIFPSIIPTLQSPTNATFSGDIFFCISSDCRINLTLEPIFSSGFAMKDFSCYFGTGVFMTFDADCNPNTLYLSSSGNLNIELVSKKHPEEKSWKSYPVEWRVSYTSTSPSLSTVILWSRIDIGKPTAHIEIDGKWKEYYEQIGDYEMNCYTLTCSLNFTAENSRDPEWSPIRWLWIYGPNDISTSRDPGTKKYEIWDHKITLRVIDSAGNYDEIDYVIHVLWPKPKVEKVKESKILKVQKITKLISAQIIKKRKPKKIKMLLFSPPEIVLQGRSGEQIHPLSYSCKYKKSPLCSMNFTLSWAQRGYEYVWTLDGEEIHRWKNPSSWKLPPWVHKGEISSYYKWATTSIHTSRFSIQVTAEPKKAKKPKKVKQKKSSLVSKIKNNSSLIPEANAENDTSNEMSSPIGNIGFALFASGALLWYLLRRRRKI